MRPDTPIWELLLPIALMGVGSGFMWAPIGTAATRNLPMDRAGAGAGVYNTTRQVGAVLGSAGIAALMQARLVGRPARGRLGQRRGQDRRSCRPRCTPAFSHGDGAVAAAAGRRCCSSGSRPCSASPCPGTWLGREPERPERPSPRRTGLGEGRPPRT